MVEYSAVCDKCAKDYLFADEETADRWLSGEDLT
jgi:hypothetical protein